MALNDDPIDLLLVNDDIVFVSGQLQFSSGTQAVAQGIDQRMRSFKGEWFLDIDNGVPYYEDILGQKFSEVKVRSIYRDILENSPGVAKVLTLTANYVGANRTTDIFWQVLTVFGDTIEGTL